MYMTYGWGTRLYKGLKQNSFYVRKHKRDIQEMIIILIFLKRLGKLTDAILSVNSSRGQVQTKPEHFSVNSGNWFVQRQCYFRSTWQLVF